jgi:hypothetical protein
MLPFLMLWIGQAPVNPPDYKAVPLSGGFVRIETSEYTIEVPKSWQVTNSTRFGQREVIGSEGRMTAMTAPGAGRQGWDRLYRTSLYFIQRDTPGRPTPYKLTKTKQGYEAATFSLLDDDGFARERYVILRAADDDILALSIKIPGKKKESELLPVFDRLVSTATLR